MYIYIQKLVHHPLAFLNSLLPWISPAPMLPLSWPVASTKQNKKNRHEWILHHLNPCNEHLTSWKAIKKSTHNQELGIKILCLEFHSPDPRSWTCRCLWIFQQSSTFGGHLGKLFVGVSRPPKQLRPAGTSPAQDFKGLPFPIVRNGKNLEMKNLLRNKICLLLEGCTFFFPKNNRNNMTRLWRFKNRNGVLVNDKMVFDLTSIPGGGVIARELSVCLRLVTKATPPKKKNGVDSSYGGFPKMVVPNNHGCSY